MIAVTFNILNPFRVDHLKQRIAALKSAESIMEHGDFHDDLKPIIKCRETTVGLRRAGWSEQVRLSEELKKARAIRFHAFRGPDRDGYWRRWVVLSKGFTAQLLENCADDDEIMEAAVEVWSSLEFCAYASDGGPGQAFRNALSFHMRADHMVLSQSGGMDI